MLFAAAVALFTACENDSKVLNQEQEIDMSDFYLYTDEGDDVSAKTTISKDPVRTCHTMNVLNRQLNENPGLAKRMYDIEYQTRKYLAAKSKKSFWRWRWSKC